MTITDNLDCINMTLKQITPIPEGAYIKPRQRFKQLAIPSGSLGRFEALANRLGAINGMNNLEIKRKAVFVFAGDHGVVEEGVSAFPAEVTVQMVKNFIKGGAGINVFARYYGVDIIVIDIGVAYDFDNQDGLINKKIAYGTKNIRIYPAMTREEAIRSVKVGIELAYEWVRLKDIDIFGTGDMGIGNTTPSSAIFSVLTNTDPIRVTGRGTGIDDNKLVHKQKVIQDAIKINKPNPNDPIDVLSKVGGFEIGGITGLILGAAATKRPIVIDGFISSAAALLAMALNKDVKDYIFVSHISREDGHKVFFDYINEKPLFDFGMRLGEGTGAVLAIGMVELASKIILDMATFSDAGVTKGDSISY